MSIVTTPRLSKETAPTAINGNAVNLRCPHCQRLGSFSPFPNVADLQWPELENKVTVAAHTVGIRYCPNSECRGVVFFVRRSLPGGRSHTHSFPPELKQFDAEGLPPAVLSALEEAIKCHAAGCYRAAALMVRRALEDMCEDQQAQGGNLAERINSLRNKIVISENLIQGAHELRFLGNDAAHIESLHFRSVGSEEADIGIDVAKQLLHSIYQTETLVRRLKALKQGPP